MDPDYDADGLAVLYRAFTFGDEEIVLNPKIRFGAPSVAACCGSRLSLLESGNRQCRMSAGLKLIFDECCSPWLPRELREFYQRDYPDLQIRHLIDDWTAGTPDSQWLEALR